MMHFARFVAREKQRKRGENRCNILCFLLAVLALMRFYNVKRQCAFKACLSFLETSASVLLDLRACVFTVFMSAVRT